MCEQVKAGTLTVLHSVQPEQPGDRFVEVRRWQSSDEAHVELVLEVGRLDEDGELTTRCKVLPFYMTLEQVLQSLDQIPAFPLRRVAVVA